MIRVKLYSYSQVAITGKLVKQEVFNDSLPPDLDGWAKRFIQGRGLMKIVSPAGVSYRRV